MATPGQIFAVLVALTALLVGYSEANSPGYSQPHMLVWCFFAIFMSISSWLLWECCLYPGVHSPLRDIPKPPGNTLVSSQWYKRFREPMGQPMRNWIDQVPNDGIIRYLDILNRERLVVTNPKALAEMLVRKSYGFIKPPHFVSGIGRILGVGLLLAEGEGHKMQRRYLNLAFTRQRIQDLYPLFWTKSKGLIDALIANNRHAPDKPEKSVDVCEWMSRATLDIIGVAGMGQEFNPIQHPDSELYQTYRKLFNPSQFAHVMSQMSLIIPGWAMRNIPETVLPPTQPKSSSESAVPLSKVRSPTLQPQLPKASSLLSIALTSGGFTDDNLVNQLMTFLIADHETTASALSWCIVMLCKHPEMQAKLRDELRSGLPNPRTMFHSVNANEFDTLPYLNAICNETLRLFPPAPLTIRVAAKDSTLLDHAIPKGTPIFIPPCAVNVSRDLWGHNAMEWNPERWIEDMRSKNGGGATSNYAFLTFLQGERRCIGEGFAKGEMKVSLVSTFEMEFVKGGWKGDVKNGFTAKPNDFFVKLRVVNEGWE